MALTSFPTAKVKDAHVADKPSELPRKYLEAQSVRKHANKRHLCDECALECDVKTNGSFCRGNISPEIQPAQLLPLFPYSKKMNLSPA